MPASPKPWLFLDVDGVLNVCGDAPQDAWGDLTERRVTVNEGGGLLSRFTVHLSRRCGEALGGLHADIVWLTTWEQHARALIAPHVGLASTLPILWMNGPYN